MGRIDAGNLYGTLSLILLQALKGEPLHGLEIQRKISALTGNRLVVEPGALYPALHRLERDDLVEAEWGVSEKGRRAKYYRLTASGRKHLADAKDGWLAHVGTILQALDLTPESVPR